MGDNRPIRIIVASPGDVNRERGALQRVVDELNTEVGVALGVLFQLSRWETDTYPAFHIEGSQAQIESILHIEDCDILICIFGRRFGTPTKHAKSGTESEFLRAYNSWRETGKPQIMMYFMKGDFNPDSQQEQEQWNALKNFRHSFPSEGLYWEYGNTREFQRLARHHLALFLREFPQPILYRVPLSSLATRSGNNSKKNYDAPSGEYRIRASAPLRKVGSDLRLPLGNFDFSVIARKLSGSNKSWYGVYIVQGRGTDEVRWHDFLLSGLGTYTYEIKTMDANETTQKSLEIVLRSQLAFSIKRGNSANRIRLTRRESIIEFWVNGERLLSHDISLGRREEVQVGVMVHTEKDLSPNSHIDVAFKDWLFFNPE